MTRGEYTAVLLEIALIVPPKDASRWLNMGIQMELAGLHIVGWYSLVSKPIMEVRDPIGVKTKRS